MIIVVVGLSHKTAPVEIREKLAFPEKVLSEVLDSLVSMDEVAEGMIVSTCNRVEIYAAGREEKNLPAKMVGFMAEYHQFSSEELKKYIYILQGHEAVKHIMRVSGSLDSMVVGEAQILGQVKEAYDLALQGGYTGQVLNRLMKKSFSVAKDIRTNTGIARNAVSISFAAVELAKKIFGDLAGKTAMIIGAGEMSELALKHLISQGIKDVMVANRTFERAVNLAREFDGSAVKFEDLAEYLVNSDIIISSTGAPHFIITSKIMKEAISRRKNKPMFLIDIAVPRDIDPKVNELDNVYLYDIDDLEAVVQANIRGRQKESRKAEEIINREVSVFSGWLESLRVFPTIVGLKEKVENIKEGELNKALARMSISEKEADIVRAMASNIVNKILHKPITVLKSESRIGNSAAYIEAVQQLFGISQEAEKEIDDQ